MTEPIDEEHARIIREVWEELGIDSWFESHGYEFNAEADIPFAYLWAEAESFFKGLKIGDRQVRKGLRVKGATVSKNGLIKGLHKRNVFFAYRKSDNPMAVSDLRVPLDHKRKLKELRKHDVKIIRRRCGDNKIQMCYLEPNPIYFPEPHHNAHTTDEPPIDKPTTDEPPIDKQNTDERTNNAPPSDEVVLEINKKLDLLLEKLDLLLEINKKLDLLLEPVDLSTITDRTEGEMG